jgi:hypothetical protein
MPKRTLADWTEDDLTNFLNQHTTPGGGRADRGRPEREYAAIVRKATNQTFVHNTSADVTFDAVDLNSGNMVYSTTQLRLPIAGVWDFGYQYSWVLNVTGIRVAAVIVAKPGAALEQHLSQFQDTSTTIETKDGRSGMWYFPSGTLIKLSAFQNSGGNLDLQGGAITGNTWTALWARLVSPARDEQRGGF